MKLLAAFFILILISAGCSTLNNSEFENSSDALNNGYYQTAIHHANKILLLDPLNAEAYLLRGKAYSRLNEQDKALNDFNSSLKIKPGFENYYSRGLEYLKNQTWQEAIADFDSAISYNNFHKEAYFTRAYTKSLLEDFEGAIEDYKKTIELDSNHYAANINLGNIYGRLGYEKDAILCFTTAIIIQPKNPDGYFNRGNQKLIMNDLEGGIEDLEKSLTIDSKNINALFLLAELKIKANDNLGAFSVLNRILSIEENAKALFLRGSIYLKLEDRNNACGDLNRAGELGYFDAYEMINKYCVKTKKKK